MSAHVRVVDLPSNVALKPIDLASTLKVIATTGNSCTAEVSGWPQPDAESLHEMAGSLVAWMEASRARDVKFSRFELLAPGHFVLEAGWS